jgi:hypothetical protein
LTDDSILLFQGPGGIGCVHKHSIVVPLAEQSSGRMVDAVEVFGKVGFTSEVTKSSQEEVDSNWDTSSVSNLPPPRCVASNAGLRDFS